MILEFCARKISVTTDKGTLGPQEKARNLQIQNAGASYKILTTQYGVVYVDLRLNFATIIWATCVCLTFRTRTSGNYSYSFHIQNFLFLLQIPDTQAQACLRTYIQQSYTKSNYQISTLDTGSFIQAVLPCKYKGDRGQILQGVGVDGSRKIQEEIGEKQFWVYASIKEVFQNSVLPY